MLLITERKDSRIYNYYQSKNLLYSIYDEKTFDLIVVFKNKKQYLYKLVPNSTHVHLMLSESNGKFFMKEVVNKFDCEMLETDKTFQEINSVFNKNSDEN